MAAAARRAPRPGPIHPSALLRIDDPERKRAEVARFTDDLRLVATEVAQAPAARPRGA